MPATSTANQLAHSGIDVPPMLTGQPLVARTSCSKATSANTAAAKPE